MPIKLLWLFVGGGLGTLGRYLLCAQVNQWAGVSFPWGVLVVNLLGCLLMGVLAQVYAHNPTQSTLFLVLMTGVLGGFTTFSAFGLDTLVLLRDGHTQTALLYVLTSVLGGLLMVVAGYEVTRWVLLHKLAG